MVLVPTAMREAPGCPSMTNRNCPVAWTKTWRPWLSKNGVGVGVVAQRNSQQNGQPSWDTGAT
jgi:hypothetical protein